MHWLAQIVHSKYPYIGLAGGGFSAWMSMNFHWVSGLVILAVTVFIMLAKFKREELRKDRLASLEERRLLQQINRESKKNGIEEKKN